jgi:hypothetical protein
MGSSWKEEVLERSRGTKAMHQGRTRRTWDGPQGEHLRIAPEEDRCLLGLFDCWPAPAASAAALTAMRMHPSESHMTLDASEDVTDHKPEQLCQQL